MAGAQVGVRRDWPRPSPTPRPSAIRFFDAPPDRWATVYAKVSGALPLDEAAAAAGGGKVLYLQGELDVTAAGTDPDQPAIPRRRSGSGSTTLAAPAGTREFTTQRDARPPCRHRPRRDGRASQGELRIEVDKPAGSTAEFTVVGGK